MRDHVFTSVNLIQQYFYASSVVFFFTYLSLVFVFYVIILS